MAVPDSIKVHTVGAQGVCHKVDFGELGLKELEWEKIYQLQLSGTLIRVDVEMKWPSRRSR